MTHGRCLQILKGVVLLLLQQVNSWLVSCFPQTCLPSCVIHTPELTELCNLNTFYF